MARLTARKRELLEELARCRDNADTEDAHCDADAALLRYIDDDEISKAYDAVKKWYA